MLSAHLNVMLVILLMEDQMQSVVLHQQTRIRLDGHRSQNAYHESALLNQLYCMERSPVAQDPGTWTNVTFGVMMVTPMMVILTISLAPKIMTGQGDQYAENNQSV